MKMETFQRIMVCAALASAVLARGAVAAPDPAEEEATPPDIQKPIGIMQKKLPALVEKRQKEGMDPAKAQEQAWLDLYGDPEFLQAFRELADNGGHLSFWHIFPLLPAGEAAPDFEAVDAVTGKAVRLSDFRGKVVVLHLFGYG